MKKYSAFLEAVEGFAGTDDVSSPEYQDAVVVLEGQSNEKKEYLKSLVADITKWSKSSEKRNQEIYDTKGDISKFDPDIKDVIDTIANVGDGESGVMSASGKARDYESPAHEFGQTKRWSEGVSRLQHIKTMRGMYGHFLLHKKLYMDAFKTGNETAKAVYVSGAWLLISYTSAVCAALMSGKNGSLTAVDMKYGKMIEELHKVITHPKYIEYLDTAEASVLNTESILYEGVVAVGSMIVGLVVTVRLIMWNIYMMRTKLSDKLRVSAEFLEKNAKRIGNTDRKNAQKISEKQALAAVKLNKVAEKLRIKLDEDEFSKPPKPSKPPEPENKKPAPDDDMDIEL